MKRIGINPGTFDPITIGHIDLIKRSLAIVDKLIVTVAKDTGKNTMFNLEKRTELVKKSLECLTEEEKSKIEVISFEGLIADFFKKHDATIIIRGLRTSSDFEYEFQMAGMNHKINPDVETVLLPTFESTQFISSSLVRQVAKLGGDISAFVPPCVKDEIEKFYSNK